MDEGSTKRMSEKHRSPSMSTLLCLLSVDHTISHLPTPFFGYNLKWPTIIPSVKK